LTSDVHKIDGDEHLIAFWDDLTWDGARDEFEDFLLRLGADPRNASTAVVLRPGTKYMTARLLICEAFVDYAVLDFDQWDADGFDGAVIIDRPPTHDVFEILSE
jgi:hypothetical protein